MAAAKKVQEDLMARVKSLEKRIIVGGENLLEKAEAQERLLEQSARDIQLQQERAQKLKQKLKEKKEERVNIEEKYTSLQVGRCSGRQFYSAGAQFRLGDYQ